jgi:hypothetical protein
MQTQIHMALYTYIVLLDQCGDGSVKIDSSSNISFVNDGRGLMVGEHFDSAPRRRKGGGYSLGCYARGQD